MSQPNPSVIEQVTAELERATAKFPTWPTDPLHALAVLGEEFGELTKATLQLTYEPHKTSAAEVRMEAIQTAAMALRFAMSLDAYEYRRSAQHEQITTPEDVLSAVGRRMRDLLEYEAAECIFPACQHNGCTCPSGDGSLAWPCPVHPPQPAVPVSTSASSRERWNIEQDGDDLLVCFNTHDKGEPCEYERFVRAQAGPAPQPLTAADFAALETDLIAECERAMQQRDEFLRTGVRTGGDGMAWNTCFGFVLRKHGIGAAPAGTALPEGERGSAGGNHG